MSGRSKVGVALGCLCVAMGTWAVALGEWADAGFALAGVIYCAPDFLVLARRGR